ncbi:hypothetical protein [Streptomyces bambusae]|uniref:Uncharacterized protein n=1 Tax=Streptomyces bambusae TaxID=1550616 RepID=A0ABS6Z8V6_9ACTN|nr:hypothetical protein [Streptomyces bambusae]MBW5484199.1 hypothetical protein [Streptomyces bambusae]
MSGISRRSLLGYSGTAAAGAVLAAPAAAQAADAADTGAKSAGAAGAQATQIATSFPSGTQFKGRTSIPPDYSGELVITFSVATADAPASKDIPLMEIADALNTIVQAHGWSPITFYGTPAPVPLTS